MNITASLIEVFKNISINLTENSCYARIEGLRANINEDSCRLLKLMFIDKSASYLLENAAQLRHCHISMT